ncbi:MAG: hypothetical protein ACI9XC_002232 [Gammaproteobacteria bacterium]|jgi:hypothetical protein
MIEIVRLNTVLDKVTNGTIKNFDGVDRVYYDGYWIRNYDIPDTLNHKKLLIDQLTRRVFHHTEPGINTPGDRVDDVRSAYEAEQDPYRKRVLAAMLAGALMNRGSDILTHMVELEEMGVSVSPENELIKECGKCFMGALENGKFIRSDTGMEGLDELWGEPFKVFTVPVEQYYASRYIKIAQTMSEIDAITDKLSSVFNRTNMFGHLVPIIMDLGESAKFAAETLRSDSHIIEVWPRFVGASDRILDTKVNFDKDSPRKQYALGKRGLQLIREGVELIISHSISRMPMPKSTVDFLERSDIFKTKYGLQLTQ